MPGRLADRYDTLNIKDGDESASAGLRCAVEELKPTQHGGQVSNSGDREVRYAMH